MTNQHKPKIRKQNCTNHITSIHKDYTPFAWGSKHKAIVLKKHVHDVCSKFASCLLHRANTPLRTSFCSPLYKQTDGRTA